MYWNEHVTKVQAFNKCAEKLRVCIGDNTFYVEQNGAYSQ